MTRSNLVAHRSTRSLAVATCLKGSAGCAIETDVVHHGPPGLALEGHELDAVAAMNEPAEGCRGEPLSACDTGWTGPSCDHVCDPGARACGFRYYCHSDGRIAGLSLSRAHLFKFEPSLDALALRDRLEQWIATHAGDLGIRDGLTTEMLQLEPADDFVVQQGTLTLYRFRQLYGASNAHRRIPTVGEGALITIQADGSGALAFSGTLMDPRVPYANASVQASASRAREAIARHTSLQSGVPVADVEIEELQLVAVPWAERIAWHGIPTYGAYPLGRALVDASDRLELLMYDEGKAYALHDTTPITVRTQDPLANPWTAPMPESTESMLTNGAPLLGSIFDGTGEPQLATEEVVVLDMNGNVFDGSLYDGISWGFERYMDASGQFTANSSFEQFGAQRLYHLVQSGYAAVDRVARGKWDSALSLYSPMLHSDYAPGAYRPRIIVGYDYAPIGHAGQASRIRTSQDAFVVAGFPEVIQQPGPNLENEVIGTINAPDGTSDAEVLLHEAGHVFDTFLAPGWPDDYAPQACPGCTPCSEDTSDEANPLTETVAQMFAMWQLSRVFPNLSHDTCDLMFRFSGGTTNNQRIVHSPGCMSPTDSLNLFLRDDDPNCPDTTVCDKPSNDEADATMGSPHWCDATEGYNTYSILQVWWNMLNGLYCAPPGPTGVDCSSRPLVWPPGCDQPSSGLDCASPDEIAALPFLYALRTNPTSYEQLFDDMARFVACNYGPQAYDDFNQALCDHEIRDCDEPLPLMCQTCGNGIREGSEQCDGSDVSNDEIGGTATCVDFGYEGGTLGCRGLLDAQPCTYDFSQCAMPGLDDSGTSTHDPTTDASTTTTTATTDGGGGADGGGGCECAAHASNMRSTLLLPPLLVLLTGRRRRSRKAQGPRSALLVMLGVAACADDVASSETASESSSTTAQVATAESSASETGAVPIGGHEIGTVTATKTRASRSG